MTVIFELHAEDASGAERKAEYPVMHLPPA